MFFCHIRLIFLNLVDSPLLRTLKLTKYGDTQIAWNIRANHITDTICAPLGQMLSTGWTFWASSRNLALARTIAGPGTPKNECKSLSREKSYFQLCYKVWTSPCQVAPPTPWLLLGPWSNWFCWDNTQWIYNVKKEKHWLQFKNRSEFI